MGVPFTGSRASVHADGRLRQTLRRAQHLLPDGEPKRDENTRVLYRARALQRRVRFGRKRKNLEVNAIDVLAEYLERNRPVTAGYQGSVVPIYMVWEYRLSTSEA